MVCHAVRMRSTKEFEGCDMNAAKEDALIDVTVYFEDREPLEEIKLFVGGRRARHFRTASLHKDGSEIPAGVPYAMELKSDVPVIVQYSRADATQAGNALLSTMAFPL